MRSIERWLPPDRCHQRPHIRIGWTLSTIVPHSGVIPAADEVLLNGGDTLVLSGLPEALALAEDKLLGAR